MILKKIALGVVSMALGASVGLTPVLAAETDLSWTNYDSGSHGFSVKFPFKNITKTSQNITPEGATQAVPMIIFMSTEGNYGPFGVTSYEVSNWPLAKSLKQNFWSTHATGDAKETATKLLKGIFASTELQNLELNISKSGDNKVVDFSFMLNSTYFKGKLIVTKSNMMFVAYHNYSNLGQEAPVYDEFINSFVAK